MTAERWDTVVENILETFSDVKRYTEDVGGESGGTMDVVEFESPIGDVRLEFVSKPRFLGETTQYSNRIGGDIKVDKQYDYDDLVHYMQAYKKGNNGDWEVIDNGFIDAMS